MILLVYLAAAAVLGAIAFLVGLVVGYAQHGVATPPRRDLGPTLADPYAVPFGDQ